MTLPRIKLNLTPEQEAELQKEAEKFLEEEIKRGAGLAVIDDDGRLTIVKECESRYNPEWGL